MNVKERRKEGGTINQTNKLLSYRLGLREQQTYHVMRLSEWRNGVFISSPPQTKLLFFCVLSFYLCVWVGVCVCEWEGVCFYVIKSLLILECVMNDWTHWLTGWVLGVVLCDLRSSEIRSSRDEKNFWVTVRWGKERWISWVNSWIAGAGYRAWICKKGVVISSFYIALALALSRGRGEGNVCLIWSFDLSLP